MENEKLLRTGIFTCAPNIPFTRVEKHNETYSVTFRFVRDVGQSSLLRYDHFIRLLLVPFRSESGC